MYRYWGFGLHIQSQIEFPELFPFDFIEPDVTIMIGQVPAKLTSDDVVHKVSMSASPLEYLLDINNVAKFYVAKGKEIIIEPYEGADTPSVRLFMLSNAMAAILHQQNKIPFHASGIITEKGLVLFTGRSGAGKSTTACGFMEKGFRLFTDDVCVLSYNKNTARVEACASYPMMKLWENTVDQMSIQKNISQQLRPNLPKFGFPQHQEFSTQSFPIAQVYILKTSPLQNDYSFRNLNSIEAFNQLQQNTYRRRQVDIMKLRESHFKIISQLTQSASITEMVRPYGLDDIPGYLNYITNLVASNG